VINIFDLNLNFLSEIKYLNELTPTKNKIIFFISSIKTINKKQINSFKNSFYVLLNDNL
jgi:hypothetical protein